MNSFAADTEHFALSRPLAPILRLASCSIPYPYRSIDIFAAACNALHTAQSPEYNQTTTEMVANISDDSSRNYKSHSSDMLKLTKKADYALMAMKHLADRDQSGPGSASAKDVADSFGIPPEALAKILQRLAKAGLLQSHHGTNGGYRLARAAHTISAFDVIEAIDGPLFITSCVTVRGECGQSDRCNIREPLRKVNDSIEAVLKRIKISHMREEPEVASQEVTKPSELVTIV
jgi:Rrf2 family protein